MAWTDAFNLLKGVMSFFVLLIVAGAIYSAAHVFPGVEAILQGLVFHLPAVPDWAAAQGIQQNPWREVMPLLGWGAGGFASQVWYTYWVLGAGYGAAESRGFGRPADTEALKGMSRAVAEKIRGWCRVVYLDATIALAIGIVVTSAFVLAGAGVLRPQQLVPKGDGVELAGSIAAVFSSQWGALGGTLFLVAADRGARRDAARPIGWLAASARRRRTARRSGDPPSASRGGRSSDSGCCCSSART